MNNKVLAIAVVLVGAAGLSSGHAVRAQTVVSNEPLRQAAIARVAQSTVRIHAEGLQDAVVPDLPGFDFGPTGTSRAKQPFKSDGTGIVVDALKGEIITAGYNVKNAQTVSITLADGTTRKATIVGVDTVEDIAVLHTEPSGLVAVNWSDSPSIGQDCAIYGVAADLGLVATYGEVAGVKLHAEEAPDDVIAVTALELSGMAGAPVFDLRGRVIGMAYARMDNEMNRRPGLGIVLPVTTLLKSVAKLTAGQ